MSRPDRQTGESASRALRTLVIAAAVVAFLLAVAARVPFLERPMSENRHADGTARVLRHMAIWDAVGLDSTHWMMRTTGLEPADRYMPDQGYLSDGAGVYYYVSFPPLYPLAPYAAFKALGVTPDPLAVRVFNLALQLVGVAALLLFVRRATAPMGERFAWIAGGSAAILYASAPMQLWYHSNAYTTASLSTPLFILAAYLALRAVDDEAPPRWVLPALAAAAFAVAFTEWLGVTMAVVAAAYGIARWRHRPSRRMAVVTVAAVGAAMLLMVVQYSSVAGLPAFIAGLTGKYAMRSGLSDTSHHSLFSLASWGYVAQYYIRGYQPFLVLMAGLAAWPLWKAWKRRRREGAPSARGLGVRAWLATPLGTASVLAAGPVLLHHLILFSHTAIHDFDMMKGASVLGLLLGLSAASLDRELRSQQRRWAAPVALLLAAALGLSASVVLSYRRDFPSHSGAQAVGERIRAAGVKPDEVVFVRGDGFYPGSAAVYYAGRNLAPYDPGYARQVIGASGASGGVLFVISDDGERVTAVERVAQDGTIVGSGK